MMMKSRHTSIHSKDDNQHALNSDDDKNDDDDDMNELLQYWKLAPTNNLSYSWTFQDNSMACMLESVVPLAMFSLLTFCGNQRLEGQQGKYFSLWL